MPMNTLFEMIRDAQGGKALDNLAKQFQLSQEQAQSAVNAVLPAFQIGLQRQAESADMMMNFLRTLSGNAETAPEPAQAPAAEEEKGADILGMLFGNQDVSRAVAAQAAQFAGIPSAIMNSMMPVLASMIMSGLMKGMTSQGYGNWLSQMASMMPGMQPRAATPQDMFTQMMGMATPQTGGMFSNMGAMMDSWMGTAKPKQPDNPMQQGFEALTGMFNAGAKVQQAHMEGMAAIFSNMLKPGQTK